MRIPVTNNTQMPIYVGANMVPAGETRLFEEADVPMHLRPAAVAPAEPPAPPPDPLVELVAKSVTDILQHFSALSDEDLVRLGELETAGKARKSLLEAIAAEQLQRAEAAQ